MSKSTILCGFLAFVLSFYPVHAQDMPAFYPHVAPILAEHCTHCHRPGGAGPMSFTNYEETVAYGAMIGYVTKTRYMPPWRADKNYGHFETPLSLSDGQIDTIQTWILAGFPMGDASEEYFQRAEPPTTNLQDWNLELTMDSAFEQYDIYFDQFQVFRLPTGLTEGRWVEAIEFLPGDASIVRYVSVSLNRPGPAGRLDDWDPRYGYTSFGGPGFMPEVDGWFTWSVGDDLFRNDGTRRYLPAGSELIMYVHYGPTGEKKLDRSKLRLKFAEADSKLPIRSNLSLINPTLLPGGKLEIPAGELTTLQVRQVLPEKIKLHSLEPQGLLLTRSWEIFARLPSGEVRPLLKIGDYDMHWRREYRFPRALELPAGSEIHARAVYDNRASNPFIPVSPPVKALWGSRLYEEQFLVRLGIEFPETVAYPRLNGTANQVGAIRRVSLPRLAADISAVEITSINQGAIRSTYEVTDRQAEMNEVTIDLNGLPYGNYRLSLIDAAGRNLAREYFIYWSPETTKSLLDE